MTDSLPMTLGGRTFDVPALPLRINMKAYPLCRKLTASGLVERVIAANGVLDCSIDEMADLAELALLGATAADKSLTREAFEELPAKPGELLDAFFTIRYQTGAWVQLPAGAADGDGEPEAAASGEATGARKPRK